MPTFAKVMPSAWRFLGRFRRDARPARQAILLWILAIAVDRRLSIDAVLDAYSEELSPSDRDDLLWVSRQLESGVPLADALQSRPNLLPPEVILSIRVGQESGTLAEMLRSEAQSVTHQVATQEFEFTGLTAYMIAITTTAAFVVTFLMYYIMPKNKKIFSDFGLEFPEATDTFILVSDWFAQYFYLVLFGFAALIWLVIGYASSLDRRFRNEPRRFTYLHAPPLLAGMVIRQSAAAAMRRLSLVVGQGRPISPSIGTMARNHPHPLVAGKLSRVFVDLENGGDNWDGFLHAGLLDRAEVNLLRSAERVGNLPWMLETVARRIDEQVDRRCRMALEVVRPLMILALSGVVGATAISFFIPLVKLVNDLS